MKNIFTKIKENPFISILVLLAIIGACCRFAFIVSAAQNPILDVALPKSDFFTYDLQAKNLLHEEPMNIKTASYPLFVLFLKTIYQYVGTSPLALSGSYFVLGVTSAILLMITGAGFFGLIPGMIAGLFLLFYKMNYLYDALRSHTALSQFLIITPLYFFSRYYKKPTFFHYIGFVFFGAILSLFRPFFAFIIVPALIYLIWRNKQYTRPAYVFFNIFICLLSIILFTKYRSQETYMHRFGIHFYLGNHAESNGLLKQVDGIRSSAEGFAVDAILTAYKETHQTDNLNRYWIEKTFASYQGQPLEFLRLMYHKIKILTNNFEPHNLTSVYYYEKKTILGGLPRINFSIVFSLAVAGIILTIKQKHPARIFLAPLALISLMVLSVFICSRYRMPVIPFLCLFASYGLTQTIQAHRNKKTRRLIILTIIILSAFCWSNQKITHLNKEFDILFWENIENKKIKFAEKKAHTLSAFKNWGSLKVKDAIQVMDALGEVGLYHEFFEHYDQAMALAQGHHQHQIILLKRKAMIYEDIRNYKNAIGAWNELKKFNPIKSQAENSIKNLMVIGPLLEKDFLQTP